MHDDEIREAVKDQVRQRKRSLWLQGHPIQARQLETGAQRRARAEYTARAVRPRPLLTPLPQRLALMKAGKVYLTTLDRILGDDAVERLQKWLVCEQLLEGSVRNIDFDCNIGRRDIGSPIPDEWMQSVKMHQLLKRSMKRFQLLEFAVLSAFTTIQNEWENALSPAQYGMRLFPGSKDKRMAFLHGVANSANFLLKHPA